MAKSLSQRIASAASPRTTISTLDQLLADCRTELERLAEAKRAHTNDSLNYSLDEGDRDAADDAARRAGREADALALAIQGIENQIIAKRNTENRQAKDAAIAAAQERRDELANRVSVEYPALAGKLADLFAAIEASDDELRGLGITNASAEAAARECEGTFYLASTPLKRLTKIQLPELKGVGLLWPNAAELQRRCAAESAAFFEREDREAQSAQAAMQAKLDEWKQCRVHHMLGYGLKLAYKKAQSANGAMQVALDNSTATTGITGWVHHKEIERLKALGVTVEEIQPAHLETANA